jgi:hypothetical protein
MTPLSVNASPCRRAREDPGWPPGPHGERGNAHERCARSNAAVAAITQEAPPVATGDRPLEIRVSSDPSAPENRGAEKGDMASRNRTLTKAAVATVALGGTPPAAASARFNLSPLTPPPRQRREAQARDYSAVASFDENRRSQRELSAAGESERRLGGAYHRAGDGFCRHDHRVCQLRQEEPGSIDSDGSASMRGLSRQPTVDRRCEC